MVEAAQLLVVEAVRLSAAVDRKVSAYSGAQRGESARRVESHKRRSLTWVRRGGSSSHGLDLSIDFALTKRGMDHIG